MQGSAPRNQISGAASRNRRQITYLERKAGHSVIGRLVKRMTFGPARHPLRTDVVASGPKAWPYVWAASGMTEIFVVEDTAYAGINFETGSSCNSEGF